MPRATRPLLNSDDGFVEVAGEMHGDWTAQRLRVNDDGAIDFGDVAPGVYAYKLRAGDGWALDAANPRTRSRAGLRNNVLVVGGTPEPILFAPAPPFVRAEDDGGVTVTAAIRRGHGDAIAIRWNEPGLDERVTPMVAVGEEDEHVLVRARMPWSAERARYAFEIAGRRVGTWFEHVRARAADTVPEWWRDAIVYAIFVDRFRRASDDAWGADPGPNAPAGGHLDGITLALDELRDLGATALYLTPVHVAASCHRYDMVDPLRVDPALGGEEAFARLVLAAHARGMRVLVDFALSHAGRGFPAYEDVLRHGRASRFADWFVWTDARTLACYGKRDDAPLLNLQSSEVRALALEAIDRWAERGVDGIRLDAAADVLIDLAQAIRARLRARRPDAIVLGEVVPAHAWRWLAAGAVDVATDFAFHRAVCDFVARGAVDARVVRAEIESADARRAGGASAQLRFVSTHDHARLATLARAEKRDAHAALGLVLLLTSPGVPAILYGEEIGLAASVAELEPEGAWADRMPMAWSAGRDERLRALVKRLVAVRASSPALRDGEVETLFAEESLLVFRRAAGGEIVDVAVNAGDAPVEIELADDEHPLLEPLVSAGDAAARGQTVVLGKGSAIVARRAHAGRPRARLRVLQLEAPRLRDGAFAARAHGHAAPPTRIDLAITERCNMRCRHCITHAPEKTASGAARTLSPWLLDRLRDAFAFAEYVGFVHGGEALAAPILFDVLRAVRAARAGFPYVAHVLTNGLLLGEAQAARLFDAGVSSISISLDGARAATNDAVRDGGRFELVVKNLRAVAALRKKARLDLRLGISAVMLRSNLDELSDLVALAADIGVDWIKLEEAVPVNAFAARSLLSVADARARDAVARAAALGKELGLVVVDHTDPPQVFRCRVETDARMRAFLESDEFANRSVIHPCRSPWERACIDPDGEVHVGDFFAPSVGNIAHASLDAMWNHPNAIAERLRAESDRPCGTGVVTCVRARSTRATPFRIASDPA